MNVLSHYTIPYRGMVNGIHHIDFDIDNKFFKAFEESIIDNGNFNVRLELDKKDNHSILTFNIEGHTNTNCDRCLESIDLPVYGEYILHVKHSLEEGSTEDVLFVHPELSVLDLAQIIYEYVLLSLPIVNTYDCTKEEKPPCNFKVLNLLDSDTDEKGPDIWSSLKGLDINN